MTTPHVTDAVLHVIKSAGYSLGETTTLNRDGSRRVVVLRASASLREMASRVRVRTRKSTHR